MSATRDHDRILRAWLDQMPDEAPDRAIANVLQATAGAPQVRTWPRVGQWRPLVHTRYSIIGAAAVIIVAVIGGALLISAGKNQPQPTLGPTESAGLLPTGLQGRWFGQPKALAGLSAGVGTVLELDSRSLKVSQSDQQEQALLAADASIVDGLLAVHAVVPGEGGCATDRPGKYRYALSASGESLTLTAVSDECAARSAALPDVWRRIDCRVGQSTCLGKLDAGVYGSQFVRPILGGAQWAPAYGAVTYTVLEGWANDSDWPSSFGLSLAGDFEKTSPAQTDPSPRLQVWTQIAAADLSAPCSGRPDPSVPRTAAGIVAFLHTVPGLVIQPGPTIGPPFGPGGGARPAWDGIDVLLSVDAATAPKCGDETLVEYMNAAGTEGLGIAPGEAQHLLLTDVGPNEVLAVRLEAGDAASLSAFDGPAMGVIVSMTFR
jgi:hypothetical protein